MGAVKRGILLAGFLCISIIVRGTDSSTADYYPAFPSHFSGYYQDSTGWVARVAVSRFQRNGEEQVRADIVQNVSTSPDEDGHFVVYSKPPGALRGTRAFNRTVFIRETKNNCSYTVSKAVMTSELPLGLTTLLGVGDQSYCVGFDVCRGLKYVDTYSNRETDEWFEPIANANGLPDNITLLVDHQTHVPFWATRYHPGHPGTFDPSRRITTKTNIVSNSPDVIFKLPPRWQSSCRNLDARIYTDSKDVFYSTPSGSDYIHIWLSDMPVGGDVTITFLAHPIPPCPCVTCVRFEPNPIRFTSVDYRRKQIVRFVYEKDGVTNFTFVVSGGGYYNRTSEEYGTVYTCHRGIPRKSC